MTARAAGKYNILKKLSMSFAAFFIFFGAFELFVEGFFNIPPRRHEISFWGRAADIINLEGDSPVFRGNYKWFWEPNPGATFCNERLNEEGYRGPIVPKKKGTATRIVTFGDSSTMGFDVTDAECWPRQVETQLRAMNKNVEVLNLGCVGYTAFHGELVYKGKGAAYSPDIVILAFGAINESFLADGGLALPEKAAVFSSFQYQLKSELSRFVIFRWLQNGRAPAAPPAAKPAHNLSPDQFEHSLVEIISLQKKAGGAAVLVSPPRRRRVELETPVTLEYTERIERVAAERKVPLADSYHFFRAREPEYNNLTVAPPADPWYLDSVHPSADGHREYARLIVKLLIEQNLVR